MIFVCFPFYDEFMLLDIMLAELGDVVDEFVLVESTMTYSGKPKPLHFDENRERYSAYGNQIVHLIFDQTQADSYAWDNERSQRNSIADYLRTVCKPDDLIILVDADEIVRTEAVQRANEVQTPGRFIMKGYYFFFNCRQNHLWSWPAFCRYRDFVQIYHCNVLSLRISTPPTCERIPDAGWHFGYVMSAARIAEKLGAFSHVEYNRSYWRDEQRIERCRNAMTDLFERPNHLYEIAPIEEMPRIIRNHPERYSEFLQIDAIACCNSVL